MKIALVLLSSFVLIGGCDSAKPIPKPIPKPQPVVVIEAEPESEPLKEVVEEVVIEQYKSLIFNTKLGVSSKQTNWVLFSNGTYILFPKGTSTDDMRKTALGLLQRYNNESLAIRKSPLVKGWIGSSSKGIYNYVSLDQAGSRMASTQELAVISKSNVMKDKGNPVIVHINTPK